MVQGGMVRIMNDVHITNRPGTLLLAALLAAMAGVGCSEGKSIKPPTWGMVHIRAGEESFYIDRFEYPNRLGTRPAKMIVFDKAQQMCSKAGKRLCTDWEWRRACLGPDMRNIFGYGPRYEEGRCHSGSKLESGHSGMTMEEKAMAPSGSNKGCRTPEGVQDMVGNLEEWVLSSWNGSAGMLEGGAWFTISRYASCTGDYSRQPHYRTNLKVPIYSAGFRCCWSPAAPTEKDLTPAMRNKDTTLRLAFAKGRVSKLKYNPANEVELAAGTFIDRFEYPNIKGERPRVGVSWEDADKACKGAGKRLCHVEEWERSCGGSKTLTYPYGDNYKPGYCSVEASGPAKAGSYSFCASEGGAQDMSGGVWEWTADEMEAPAEIYGVNQKLRHVRGGSWFVDPHDGACRPELGYPTAHQKAVYTDVGFRCCRGEVYKQPLIPTGGSASCPSDMVAIKDFCVDVFEFPNIRDEPPLHDLNFTEAKMACTSVGLHVCSEKEWTLACAGTMRRPWPYGFSYEAKTCHYGLLPNDENYVVVSGTMPKCKSPEGIYDMSGNVWEWTVSPKGGGELRGGGANISAGYGRCNAKARARDNFSTFETGVRCCGSQAEVDKLQAQGGRPTIEMILATLKPVLERKKNAPMQERFEEGAPMDPPETQPLDGSPDEEQREAAAREAKDQPQGIPVTEPLVPGAKGDMPRYNRGTEPPRTGEDRPTWRPNTEPKVVKPTGDGPTEPALPNPAEEHTYRPNEPPVIAGGDEPTWSPGVAKINKPEAKANWGKEPPVIAGKGQPSWTPPTQVPAGEGDGEPTWSPATDPNYQPEARASWGKEPPAIPRRDTPTWYPPTEPVVRKPSVEQPKAPVLPNPAGKHAFNYKEPPAIPRRDTPTWYPPTEPVVRKPSVEQPKAPVLPNPAGKHAFNYKEPPVIAGGDPRPSYSPSTQKPPTQRRRQMPARKSAKSPWQEPPVIKAEPRGPGAPPPLPPQADPSKQANVKVCTVNSPVCPPGLICCFMQSVCCLAPLECMSNAGCPDGERCYLPHKRCYLNCGGKMKCRWPYTCDPVQKVCRPPGATCTDTDECPTGMRCHPQYYYCYK